MAEESEARLKPNLLADLVADLAKMSISKADAKNSRAREKISRSGADEGQERADGSIPVAYKCMVPYFAQIRKKGTTFVRWTPRTPSI